MVDWERDRGCNVWFRQYTKAPHFLRTKIYVSTFQVQLWEAAAGMEQQLLCPAGPEWDEEGFPLALGEFGPATRNGLDEENGEWVKEAVCVLRHLPQDTSSCPSPSSRLVQEMVQIHWPLQRRNVFRGYAQDVLLRLNNDLAREHTRDSLCKLHQNDLEALKTRRMFQIPPEILKDQPGEAPRPMKTKIYYISIWKEFIYGPPVLMLERQCLTHRELGCIKPLTFSLAKFFNRTIVDWSLHLLFFAICFVYCLIFHDILEVGLNLLYVSHLSIHMLANSSNIEVKFTGSFFQGPAYAFIRLLCQHCAQEENAKVMRRHMVKMKQDIMNAEVT